MKKHTETAETRKRLDSLLDGSSGGGYHISTAASDPLKRRLRGRWEVREHSMGGESYLSRFAARALKGVELTNAEYRAEYEFREGICLKRVEILGALPGGEADEPASYRYRLRMASTWDLDGTACLSIRPELGYQCTELGGETAAVKDLDDPPESVSVSFRFEDEALVLEEGDDFKRLERIR